jgi:glycosyltransferase involved in cell wall biosynthesis
MKAQHGLWISVLVLLVSILLFYGVPRIVWETDKNPEREFLDSRDIPKWIRPPDGAIVLDDVEDTIRLKQVAIMMAVHNNEKHLPHTLTRVEWILSQFQDGRVYIYEDGSSDETGDVVKKWCAVDLDRRRCKIDGMNATHPKDSTRFQRIALARDNCLSMYRSDKEYQQFTADYVIVMDADLTQGFTKSGFLDCFHKRNTDRWNVVFAAGYDAGHVTGRFNWLKNAIVDTKPGMYDRLATVDMEGNTNVKLRLSNRGTKQDNLHQVYSAFGGVGIYEEYLFENVSYATGLPGNLCEHVHLHNQMYQRNKGTKMFINKNFTVLR